MQNTDHYYGLSFSIKCCCCSSIKNYRSKVCYFVIAQKSGNNDNWKLLALNIDYCFVESAQVTGSGSESMYKVEL